MSEADLRQFRSATFALAVALSAALVVVYPLFRVVGFADGSFFVLSILSPDPWTLAWASYPNRLSAFLLTIVPPFLAGRLTGSAAFAVGLYSVIMAALPLAGLLATRRLEEKGSNLSFCCAVSTIVLALSVAFFPTEMWLAHAMIWPLLAYATRRRDVRTLPLALFALVTAFVHEAAAPLVALVLLNGYLVSREQRFLAVLVATVLPALIVKVAVRIPNAEIQRTVQENALNFLSPDNLINNISVTVVIALVLLQVLLLFRAPKTRAAVLVMLASIVAIAALVMVVWPGEPHVLRRYIARTIVFCGLAAFLGLLLLFRLAEAFRPQAARLAEARIARHRTALALNLAVVVAVSAVGHVFEGARFLYHWQVLEAAIAGPAPAATSLPKGVSLVFSDGSRTDGTAVAQPRGWPVAWDWSLPYQSAVNPGPAGSDFIVVAPAASFTPITCATIGAMDAEHSLAPRARVELLKRNICRIEATTQATASRSP
jgi:hypothetical protein